MSLEARLGDHTRSALPLSGLRERMRRSPWGTAGISFVGAAGHTGTSSSSRVSEQRQRLILKASDTERKSLRPEDWHRVVEEVWQARDSRWVLQRIRERPITSDLIVAFKAMLLMHRVLLQGPPESAAEWGIPNSMLDQLVAAWTFSCQARIAKGSQQMHCAQAVIEYARLLMAKMELMIERDAGRGRFDGSLVYNRPLREPSDMLEALGKLLNFAEKLMPLALHLVAPSKDWQRLGASHYIHVYIGGILALLHDAWLLLCAMSLSVKNLLCLVHQQKRIEDYQNKDARFAPPQWLQLALHLLAAQPRFARFHQSMCDFVAHCHQLRVAGFPELAPYIPMVPSSLLNLFADLGELVKGQESKDKFGRAVDSISSLSTGLPTDETPSQRTHDGQTLPGSWEPSPCVVDALRTVDSLQRTALVASRGSTSAPEAEAEPVATGGGGDEESNLRSESTSGTPPQRPSSLMQSTVTYLEEKWPREDANKVSRDGRYDYALLDDDADESMSPSRGSAPAGSPDGKTSPSDAPEDHVTSPLVTSDDDSSPVPFVVWPDAAPWRQAIPFQGYGKAKWPPEADATPSASSTAAPSVAVFDNNPPSWAAAICRSNISGSMRSDIGDVAGAPQPFRGPRPHSKDASSAQPGPDKAASPQPPHPAIRQASPVIRHPGASVEAPMPGRSLEVPAAPHRQIGGSVAGPAAQQRHAAADARPPRAFSVESATRGLAENSLAMARQRVAVGAITPKPRSPQGVTNPFELDIPPAPPAPQPPPARATIGLRPEECRENQAQSFAPGCVVWSPNRGRPQHRTGQRQTQDTPRVDARAVTPRLQRPPGAEVPVGAGWPPGAQAQIRLELPGMRKRAEAPPPQVARNVPTPKVASGGERPVTLQVQHAETAADASVDRISCGAASGATTSLTPKATREAAVSPSFRASPRAAERTPRRKHERLGEPAAVQPRMEPSTRAAPSLPVAPAAPDRSPTAALVQSTPSPFGHAGLPSDWEVDMADLRLEEVVGHGTTAEVYRGSWFGTDVAVKKLRHSGLLSMEFTRELSVLLRLRHPNLVLFMGASISQAHPMIISEFCTGGTVFSLLHQRPCQPISWAQRLKIALDVAKGMNFLHRRQVVHRDLKSLNLLLADRVTTPEEVPAVKISDFGLSRMSSADPKAQACMTSGAGTYHWMAPEVLDGHKYDEKVDVYSYGICLFELLARRIPYDGSGLEPVSIAVAVSKGRRPDLSCVPQDCPADLRFTMECCWAHCPTGRPGFDTILETLKLVQFP